MVALVDRRAVMQRRRRQCPRFRPRWGPPSRSDGRDRRSGGVGGERPPAGPPRAGRARRPAPRTVATTSCMYRPRPPPASRGGGRRTGEPASPRWWQPRRGASQPAAAAPPTPPSRAVTASGGRGRLRAAVRPHGPVQRTRQPRHVRGGPDALPPPPPFHHAHAIACCAWATRRWWRPPFRPPRWVEAGGVGVSGAGPPPPPRTRSIPSGDAERAPPFRFPTRRRRRCRLPDSLYCRPFPALPSQPLCALGRRPARGGAAAAVAVHWAARRARRRAPSASPRSGGRRPARTGGRSASPLSPHRSPLPLPRPVACPPLPSSAHPRPPHAVPCLSRTAASSSSTPRSQRDNASEPPPTLVAQRRARKTLGDSALSKYVLSPLIIDAVTVAVAAAAAISLLPRTITRALRWSTVTRGEKTRQAARTSLTRFCTPPGILATDCAPLPPPAHRWALPPVASSTCRVAGAWEPPLHTPACSRP